MTFESSKVRAIKLALRKNGGSLIKFIKIHGSEFTESGTPDIIGCYRRICFVLECKNERGELSEIQKVRLREWKRAGAIVGVPRSGQEAVNLVIRRVNKEYDQNQTASIRPVHFGEVSARVQRSRKINSRWPIFKG